MDHKSFFSLNRYVDEFVQIISFCERNSFKLRLETVIGIVLCCCHKYVAFFTIWAELTMPFTYTSFPLNLYTSVFRCGRGFGFEQTFWRIDGFGEKMAWIGRFAYPYSPNFFAKIWLLRPPPLWNFQKPLGWVWISSGTTHIIC